MRWADEWPALFTSTSIRPQGGQHLGGHALHRFVVRHVEAHHQRGAALPLDFAAHGRELALGAPHYRHPRPLRRHHQRGSAADSAPPAGNDT